MPNDNHLLAKIGQYALVKNDDKVLVLERANSKTLGFEDEKIRDVVVNYFLK